MHKRRNEEGQCSWFSFLNRAGENGERLISHVMDCMRRRNILAELLEKKPARREKKTTHRMPPV